MLSERLCIEFTSNIDTSSWEWWSGATAKRSGRWISECFYRNQKNITLKASTVFSDRQMAHLIHTGYERELSAVMEWSESQRRALLVFREKEKEPTVSTSNANIRLEDVTGLSEDLIYLKWLNSL